MSRICGRFRRQRRFFVEKRKGFDREHVAKNVNFNERGRFGKRPAGNRDLVQICRDPGIDAA